MSKDLIGDHVSVVIRLDGNNWLLENCRVEYMNAVGVSVDGDDCIVRNCYISNNGQIGFNANFTDNALFENCVTMYNNYKLFSWSWGGGGNKLIPQSVGTKVKGLVSAFNYGAGLWHDFELGGAVVE